MGKTGLASEYLAKLLLMFFEESLYSKSTWVPSQERPREAGEISSQDNPLTAHLETGYAEG